MLRLRLSEGIVFDEFLERFGFDFRVGRDDKLRQYEKMGLATFTDTAFSLNERGFFISNAILVDLI